MKSEQAETSRSETNIKHAPISGFVYDHKYDDIIQLEHPKSKKHPQMSLYDRAAQFAPFAALTGHEAALAKTLAERQDRIAREYE